LGQVEISGSTPNAKETAAIKRALLALQHPPAPPAQQQFTPEQIESAGLGGLAETMRGFQELEGPSMVVPSATGEDFERRASQRFGVLPIESRALEQAGRALVGSTAGLARSAVLESAAGAIEAATDAEMGEGWRPERLFGGDPVASMIELIRPGLRSAAEEVEAFEKDVYQPSEPVPGEAWAAVADDPTRLGRLILEGIAGSAPHFIATLASPVRYAAALVGDIAKGRAKERGDNKVTGADFAVAIPTATAISGLNRAAQVIGWDNRAAHTLMQAGLRSAAAEIPTETAQSIIEVAGRQAYARPGGVSSEDLKQAAIGAATVGGPMGFLGGMAGARFRRGAEPTVRQDEPSWPIPVPEPAAEAVTEQVVPEQVVTEQVVPEQVVTEEVVAEPVGPAFDPKTDTMEYRAALDEPYVSPRAEYAHMHAMESIFQRPGAGPYLATMRNMALGRLEGNPFSERLRFAAKRSEELWRQYRSVTPLRVPEATEAVAEEVVTPTAEVVTEEVVTPTEEVAETALATPAPQDAPPIDAVDAIIESIDESTVPGEFTQVAPVTLPMDAGTEVEAVDVVRETTTIIEDIEGLRDQVKAAKAEEQEALEGIAPRPGTTPVKRKKGRKLNEAEQKLHELEAVQAALDPGRPVVDVLDAAVEGEGAGARVLAGTQEVMKARNEDVVAFLESMGRTPEQISSIMRREAAGYAETLHRMRAEKLETTVDGAGNVHMGEKMSVLVDTLLERPYQVSGIEQTALLSGLVQSQKAWSDTTQRIGDLDAKEVTDPAERNAIDEKIRKLDAKRREISETGDKIARANTLAGTRTSEAFKARQWGVDSEMTLFQARATARAMKGSKLDPKETEFIDKEFAEADKLIAEATKAKAEADKKLKDANKKLLSATKDLKRAQGIKEATAKVAKKAKPKEAREKTRKEAAEESVRWGIDKPIRVTPLRMSPEEKAARKAFRKAQKKVKAAREEAADAKGKRVKAEGADRRARTRKRKAPEEALRPLFLRRLEAFWQAARTSVASLDVSAMMRQGAVVTALMPKVAIRSLRHAWGVRPRRGDADRAYAHTEQRRILDAPMQEVRDWAGLEITEVEGQTNVEGGPMSAREEMFVTDVFRSGALGPVGDAYGKVVITPSQNSFGLMLNDMRTQLFDSLMLDIAEGRGAGPNATPEQVMAVVPKADAEALAVAINAATGRGRWLLTSPEHGATRRQAVNILNPLVRWSLFAPRHSASRLEMGSHLLHLLGGTGPFKSVSKGTLSTLRNKATRVLGTWFTLGMLGVLSAGEFEDEDLSDEQRWERKRQALRNYGDPTHGAFGKAVFGKHHIDPTGGAAGTNRLIISGILAMMNVGRAENPEPSRVFGRLVRNKLHPVAAAITDMMANEDYLGRELADPHSEMWAYVARRYIYPAMGMVTPITVQTLADAAVTNINEEDIAVLDHLGGLLADTIGMSDQVYTEGWKPQRKRKRPRRPRRPSPRRYSR